MKLALDANVVIYAIEYNSPPHQQAFDLLQNAPIKGYETQVSELTFLEALSRPDLTNTEAREFYETVRRIASVNWPIDTSVLLKAAELRRTHIVKTPDAIHLATAILHGADYFVTNDNRLIKLKKVSGLKIISLGGIKEFLELL